MLSSAQVASNRKIRIGLHSRRGVEARFAGKIGVPATAHRVVKEFLRLMNRERVLFTDLAKRSGYHRNTICHWGRRGRVPRIDQLEDVLNAMDYELCIRPKNGFDDELATTSGADRVLVALEAQGDSFTSIELLAELTGYAESSVETFMIGLKRRGVNIVRGGVRGAPKYRIEKSGNPRKPELP